MPRPKGSKNKKKAIPDLETVTQQIEAAESEIEELSEALKAKKAALKVLMKEKLEAEAAAVAQKAEEDKAAILAAIEAFGKSVEEILELLK